MDTKPPLVSVIIPTFNRAEKVCRAIQSVLAQTYPKFEIIVVDDNSKDNTQKVIQDMVDSGITYIRHSQNLGGSAARNTGIRQAKGDFIAFLDSDDEWMPEKLTKQMRLFSQEDNTLGVVYTGQLCLNDDGSTSEFIGHYRDHVLDELLTGNFIGSLSTVMVRATYVKEIGGLDASLKSCQDWDFYIRLSKLCRFDVVEECLVKYYRGRSDKFRISNNRTAIFSGHERVRLKYADDYSRLSNVNKLRYSNHLRGIYALNGDYVSVLKLSLMAVKECKSLMPLFSSPIYLARAAKRNLTRNYAY